MRLSLVLPFSPAPPGRPAVAVVQAAERLGCAAVWVADVGGWDPFVLLARLAGVTEQIELGTAVVDVFGRSPAQLAQSTATVDAASGGRFRLGLGTSGPAVAAGRHGLPYERPLTRLRETVEVVRRLLAGEALHHRGRVFDLDSGFRLAARPVRPRVPVYLGCISPAGVALAGEIADGWLPVFFSPAHFATVLRPDLERGAAAAGRDLAGVAVCANVTVFVSERPAQAREEVREHVALYVGGMGTRERNFYHDLFHRYGLGSEADRVRDRFLAGRRDEAARAVTDEMVDVAAVVGTAEECRARLDDLERVGVDEVAVRIGGAGIDPAEQVTALEALAE